jgi:hypothetical protein
MGESIILFWSCDNWPRGMGHGGPETCFVKIC